jgi:ElaB/YqjD/DUF883 family membrane-anchored ribosome-binding protein
LTIEINCEGSSMASTFSRLRDDLLSGDLEDQVARLQKEVAHLRKLAGKHGASAMVGTRDTALDLYDDIAERVADLMPHVRRQSRVMGRAASDHPVATAVIGLAVIGLAIGLLTRR